jgi:hypothetical protein
MNKKILLLLFVLLNTSCYNKDFKNAQAIVFNDVFTELIMISTQDNRKVTFPNPEQIKSWKQGKNISKKHQNDNKQLLIVINDSIKMPRLSNNHHINSDVKYKFDYSSFSTKLENIKLISKSKFKNKAEFLKEKIHFGGHLNISEIHFENESKASVIVNYNCGNLCGQSSKVYFELVNHKWKIIKTEVLTIS